MKANKFFKAILAFMAVLIIFSLTAAVFAQAETNTTEETTETQAEPAEPEPSRKDGRHHWMKDIDDDDDDDDKSDKENLKDLRPGKSGAPADGCRPMQGQKKGRGFGKDAGDKENRPLPQEKDNDDRKNARRHGIDFSELPDDPTDEQIVEFFRKYFLGEGKNDEETVKSPRPGKDGKPFGCRHPEKPGAAQETTEGNAAGPAPETENATETVTEPPAEIPEEAPAEETAEETTQETL